VQNPIPHTRSDANKAATEKMRELMRRFTQDDSIEESEVIPAVDAARRTHAAFTRSRRRSKSDPERRQTGARPLR
jgi:hypothetical protein